MIPVDTTGWLVEKLSPGQPVEGMERLGDVMAAWEIDEYPQYERSALWYLIMSTLGIALVLYSVLTQNFLFGVIILMGAVIVFMNSMKAPPRVPVVITSTGILVDDRHYDWRKVKQFFIVYEPPAISTLYIRLDSLMLPLMSVPLEEENPNDVREALLPYVSEDLERDEETWADLLRRLYKI
ncbi:hypothetical protein HYV73_00030 [Candidatus Uhrbacteria bacterium]|nr:hypothetical protein [Candidatus Uhrbacteria bacterium]